MPALLISEEQLTELVESVWSAMLDLPITPLVEEPFAGDPAGLAACVEISGAFNGTVLWLPTEPFARRATARMLGTSERSLAAADVNDAMAELCNIVSGAAKGLLPGPSYLSTPRVMRHSQLDPRWQEPKIAAQLRFHCEDQPLQVRILSE